MSRHLHFQGGDHVRFDVKDTGRGKKPEELPSFLMVFVEMQSCHPTHEVK